LNANQLNGTALSGLATGILKNTTTTGVPSIAISSDVIGLWSGTCNASTVLGGNGACVAQTSSLSFSSITTGSNTTATMTVGTGASLTFSGTGTVNAGLLNGTSLAGLATGLLKNTTTTGVPSIAVAGTDYVATITGSPCTNQVITAISTAGAVTCTTVTSAYVNTSIAVTGAGNTYTTGDQNMSSATAFEVPVVAGGTSSVDGRIVYDSTLKNIHIRANGADAINAAIASAPTDGRCAQWSNVAGTILLTASGAGCGSASTLTINSTAISGGATNAVLYGDGTVLQNASGVTRTAAGTFTFSTSVISPLYTAAAAMIYKPGADSTTAHQFQNSSGTTVFGIDTLSNIATITRNAIGVTAADGFILTNTTAAAVGAQQESPAIHWTGQGWKTTATAASQAVDCRQYLLPVQGAANPTGWLETDCSINGGTYNPIVTIPFSASATAAMGIWFGTPTSNTGILQGATSELDFYGSGSRKWSMQVANIAMVISKDYQYSWSSNSDPGAAAQDTAISRVSAGVVGFGKTTTLSASTAKVQASAYQSAGTTFTISGCSTTSLTGGGSAGKFTSGTTGTCTPVITMGDSATAANGWACAAADQTTPADVLTQTASTTTTATLSGPTLSGDVISFHCIAY
jgi:hypothetical protein